MTVEVQTIERTDVRDAFFDRLYEIASQDSDVFFLSADMGAFSLEKFRKNLPGQFINVGIAEQNLINVATGLALGGKKVFVYGITAFVVQRCYEQIKVNICGMQLPITIVGVGGGTVYGSDGLTHHAVQDIANMRALPEITIISPSDPAGFQAAAEEAYSNGKPNYVRLDKGLYSNLASDEDFASGMYEIRKGKSVLLLTTGVLLHNIVKVAEELYESGVDAGVVGLHKIQPLNKEGLLSIIKDYSSIVTIEDHINEGGIGSMVSELITDTNINTPLKKMSLGDAVFKGYGDRDWMFGECGLDKASLVQSITDFLQRISRHEVNKAGRFVRKSSQGREYNELDVEAFSNLLAVSSEEFSEECKDFIEKTDFRYIEVSPEDREMILFEIMTQIDSGKLTSSGSDRKDVWEKGWSENLNEFVEADYDLEKLVPKFVRRASIKRLCGKFILPENPDFEQGFVRVLRDVLFRKYFSDVKSVYEFGCGTGLNLVHLANIYPEKKLYGLDWAQASCDIIDNIAESKKLNLTGIRFDMFNPDHSIELSSDDGMFTIGALEQLGKNFGLFLDFILERKPKICINFETMNEIYANKDVLDYVSKKYSKARNYLFGYLSRLRELEQEGKVEIIQVQRTFGSQYHEGYSFVVWKPLL